MTRVLKRVRLSQVARRLLATLCVTVTSCATHEDRPPLEPVPQLDLSRFMGNWYVAAHIPTFVEKGAHNAVERYEQRPDGNIDIQFTFRKDSLDGPEKKLTMTGYPLKEFNNARWTVSPFWPLRLPYYTIDLADDYSWVIVATPYREYLWIMTRETPPSPRRLEEWINKAVAKGFPRDKIIIIPHR